jgi:glucan endo-1,3-alpha-glucosidase
VRIVSFHYKYVSPFSWTRTFWTFFRSAVPCTFTHFTIRSFTILDMQLHAPLFCLLTLFFSTSAYVIPLRRVRIPSNIPRSPSENDVLENRSARFVMKRQEPSIAPYSIITLAAAASATSTTPTSQSTYPSSIASPASISTSTLDSTTTTDAAPQPSQPPIDSDGSRKYVVAHHMVGNTFPYTPQDWADDIALAHASGIDGFALNMGTDDWQPGQVANA